MSKDGYSAARAPEEAFPQGPVGRLRQGRVPGMECRKLVGRFCDLLAREAGIAVSRRTVNECRRKLLGAEGAS